MNVRLLVGALALLMVGAGMPALAYHIDNARGDVSAAAGDQTMAGDFELGNGFLIACEAEYGWGNDGVLFGPLGSSYPQDVFAADDRTGYPILKPNGDHGDGGLCTTGENDASGRLPPGQVPCGAPWDNTNGGLGGVAIPACFPPAATGVQASAPVRTGGPDDYTRLDACNRTTATRNGGAFGPYNNAGTGAAGTCAAGVVGGIPGDTNDHAWTFQTGIYTCFIPTTGTPGIVSLSNYAAYYDRLYLYWEFDGVPQYTFGDAGGMPHSGDTPQWPIFVDDPFLPLGASFNADAFHGHAAMFIETADSPLGFTLTGSAETAPGSAGQNSINGGATNLWYAPTMSSNCDNVDGFEIGGMHGAPGEPVYGCAPSQNVGGLCGGVGGPVYAAPVGPVFRACYDAADVDPSVAACVD